MKHDQQTLAALAASLLLGTMAAGACTDEASPSSVAAGGAAGADDMPSAGSPAESAGGTGGEASTPAESGASGDGGFGGVFDSEVPDVSGGTGGEAGAPGPAATCELEDGECPADCFELPVISGCGDEAIRSLLCTSRALQTDSAACGVRLGDGELQYVDAAYTYVGPVTNPFGELEGFRACTAEEVEDSDCRDLSDLPSVASVRFELTSRRYGLWLMRESSCAPFDLFRDGEAEPLAWDRGDAVCGGGESICLTSCLEGEGNFTVVQLDEDETFSITWDGRQAEAFERIEICADDAQFDNNWVGRESRCTDARLVPSSPGRYRATFGVFYHFSYPGLLPVDCDDDAEECVLSDGFFQCWQTAQSACHIRDDSVSVEFDLPESGDVVVPVSLR